jgi:hypothetical protein
MGEFVIYGDQADADVRTTKPGWWAKLDLFDPAKRPPGRCLYFDLDTVIVNSLDPLAALDVDFGVCANFTRAVNPKYPCRYGSCVMTFADGWGSPFVNYERSRYGDQYAIEQAYPDAALLQDELPDGYFVGRREFSERVPDGAAIMVFAGAVKPCNTKLKWVEENWR